MKLHAIVAALAAACITLACASEPQPRFATGEHAEVTNDGLRLLNQGYFTKAWARPTTAFSRYDAALTQYGGIVHRRIPRGTPAFAQRSSYELTPELNRDLMQHLQRIFDEAIVDAEGWEISSEPGANVVIARAVVVDLVLFAPLEHLGGDDLVFVDSVGQFTLVIELVDSESGTILARAAERRSIQVQGGANRPIRATPGDTVYESKIIFQDWAHKLTELLDDMRYASLSGSLAE